ncbi:cobalamin biosynthesis protein CobG [Streptomyces sp. NRRL S-350]|uniref:cobalamin biosynthesis protein CobG n=1 Tax=Streptomyces sp. NRRL S-350 TaxID=1463902 RepID=UPI001F44B750|nr:cobalamin biosynthesis protein CobG [Streptomyces sp. NRRL S-350]
MPPTPDATAPGAAVPDREVSDRGHADACPGALRLHPADDGSLARIRLPGGLLTDRQATALADAAEALGDGELETTSRGNVQLRGLAPQCAADLADRLRAAGLLPSDTHERIRNIVASPLAGLDATASADVQAWVRELDTRLCASDWATGLSGKFLFALDDGRGDVAALDADVTLIAGSGGPALLRLGRSTHGLPVEPGQEVTAVLDAARSFLDALRADGRRAWHLREVPDLLPAGSVPLPAYAGTAPEVGALPGGLSVGLRFGRASAGQWRSLVAASAGRLRLTPWRGVVLPGAPAERLPALAEAGFRTEPGSPWERATACTGLPGCAKSRADVRSDAARALGAAIGAPGAADASGVAAGPSGVLPVHWSGCERRCGHPAGRWVDVLATGHGYRVTVNGPAAAPTAVDVTNEEMAEAVAEARRTTK